jgi:hypothetical protein
VKNEAWRGLTPYPDLEGPGGEEGSEVLEEVAMDANGNETVKDVGGEDRIGHSIGQISRDNTVEG